MIDHRKDVSASQRPRIRNAGHFRRRTAGIREAPCREIEPTTLMFERVVVSVMKPPRE